MPNSTIVSRIKLAIEKIRPMLAQDGGDVEFVSFDEVTGVVKVKLQGHCAGCPMAQMTLQQGIERAIKQEAPEVKEVRSIKTRKH